MPDRVGGPQEDGWRSCAAERTIAAPADRVRALVLDVPGHVAWFAGAERVARLDATGGDTWRMTFAFTAMRIRVVRGGETSGPIVWRTSDERGHFEAEWRFAIESLGPERCRVAIEERRRVRGLLARAWQRLLLRPDHYVRKYLDHLAAAAETDLSLRRSSAGA